MRRTLLIPAVVSVAALGGTAGVALAAGGHGSAAAGSSRLDDGASPLPRARITEQEAVAAAQRSAAGALNDVDLEAYEVDLEAYQGRLVFNVDVGDRDVKVDASDGTVLGAAVDDTRTDGD